MKKAKALLHDVRALEALVEDTKGASKLKFLLVLAAKHPEPVVLKECEAALNITQGQVSRLVRAFHSIDSQGEVGLGLIDIEFDLYSPRTKLVSLNKKGEAALKAIFR